MTGWFPRLFGRDRLTIDDPFLGKLVYDEKRYGPGWFCTTVFQPVDQRIKLHIDAPRTGPTERERDLLRELQHRYNDLLPSFEEPMFEATRDWRDAWSVTAGGHHERTDIKSAHELWDVVELERVVIYSQPNDDYPGVEVDLRYLTPWDDEHLLCVLLGDWRVIEVFC